MDPLTEAEEHRAAQAEATLRLIRTGNYNPMPEPPGRTDEQVAQELMDVIWFLDRRLLLLEEHRNLQGLGLP